MKSFKEFIMEMPRILKHYDKNDNKIKVDLVDSKILDTAKKVSETENHDIYRRGEVKRGNFIHYVALNKKTKLPDMLVSGNVEGKKKPHLQVANLQGREGSTLKAHDFYDHIIQNHHPIRSDTMQSVGAMKVWKKIKDNPSVKVKHMGITGRTLKFHPDFEKNYTADKGMNKTLSFSSFMASKK